MLKQKVRPPLLRRLRSLGWYRALTGIPRNEIASCRDVAFESHVDLDPETTVALPAPAQGNGGRTVPLPGSFLDRATSVTVLRGGRLYGKGVAAIAPDDRVLRDATVYLSGPLEEHSVMRRFRLPRARRLPGRSAVLSVPGANRYYHWMLEVLPRLDLLRRAGHALEWIDHFVVTALRHPFQRETLERFGILGNRIVESDEWQHLRFERMILPSLVGAPGFSSPRSVAFLRAEFAAERARPSGGPRRIHVSRRRSRNRRIVNADELRPVLEARGVVEVFPEEMTVAEQVSLFAGAELVVAPHGGGLTNIVFCQPGTRVIEIFNPGDARTFYPALAAVAGVMHRPLWGSRAVGRPALEDYEVDPRELEKMIG